MSSYKAYFKKELIEGIRNYKFLILAIGIILFAILDPIMLKLLPEILKGQTQGVDISQFMNINHRFSITNYMNDIYNIANIVIALTLMGVITDEIKDKNIVIPLTKGLNLEGLVIAKTLVYSLIITSFTFVGFIINYYYSQILFPKDLVSFSSVMKSCLLYSIYLLFVISLIYLLSSLFKKGIIAALLSILIIYTMPLIMNIKILSTYLPFYLIKQANNFNVIFDSTLIISILWTLIYIVIITVITIERLKRIEIN
ncbi:MAG: ABC transporter permease [Firmicutes bacterium]|nr:ABC transporter permease [Bacillota bacterium]